MKKSTILSLGILLGIWDYYLWLSWNVIMYQPFSEGGGTGIIYLISLGVTVIYILKIVMMIGEIFKKDNNK
jgi:hypothetical protein